MTTEEGMDLLLRLDALLEETPGRATAAQRSMHKQLDRLYRLKRPPFTQPEVAEWWGDVLAPLLANLEAGNDG